MINIQTKPAESASGPEANARAHKPATRPPALRPLSSDRRAPSAAVGLLTGGSDKPYALGIAEAITNAGLTVDFIGSDELDLPELRQNSRVRFLNLRGDQRANATFAQKARRVMTYYLRLLRYAATAKPRIFHILWNNKCELFDRTLLMQYYKWLGKTVVLTAHNVNKGKRDGTDSFLNRLSLKIQYHLADHIFVHTQVMKNELLADFAVPKQKVSVIPFGINNTVPSTALTAVEAKRKLGINPGDKTVLFYGNIAPYKGLEFLIAALTRLKKAECSRTEPDHEAPTPNPGPRTSGLRPVPSGYRLIIAGRVKRCDTYWNNIQTAIVQGGLEQRVVKRIEFIPDEETEFYFKAADVLVLPYTHIFQSGVLFLAYSFGLPVIAADVGSLEDEIIEGETGFVFPAKDSTALAQALQTYFSSDLYKNLADRRPKIRASANERYSWTKVAAITTQVYSSLIEN